MSQFIEMFGNPVTNNKGWNTLPIKDVAPEAPSLEKQTGKVWILNLDMIESNTGKVVEKVFENDSNLLPVAPFDEGNVLYSKLRPYLNKVVIPDGKGYATTELVPLRPNQKLLNLTFFSHLLRGDDFVTYANSISTGTKMPRMPLNDLRKFQCILPPMEKQNEFEEIARQADKSGFDELKSQFIEMTGDPRTNPKGWPVKTLSELATYSIGLTYKPENISEEGTIVLRSGNIQNSKIDLADVVRVNCPIKESIYVQKNDILMCSRNGSAALVGKVAQIKDISEPMTYGAFMTVIRSEYSDFLYLYFQSNDFREQVSTGKSSTMNQITQNMLDKISLPLPDDETRNKLSIILHQADKSGSVLQYMIAC
jgi:type I restriction enzyme S subunit